MAASSHNLARALASALLTVSVAAAAAAPVDSRAPINLEAASSDFDYRNNTLLFRRVKITQGPLTVEAQEASATGLVAGHEAALQGILQEQAGVLQANQG